MAAHPFDAITADDLRQAGSVKWTAFPDTIGANIIHGAEPMVPYEAVTEGAEVAPTLEMTGRTDTPAAPAASANDNATQQPAAAAAN